MKIVSAYVVVTSPGRNFVTLKVTTDEGLTGLGDATLNGRELSVAAYLTEHVIPLLIGRDPQQIEDTWQYLYRGAYWRRGPVTMASIAAVDMALWDIKGKISGMPVYQLLGGASRLGLLAYGHASGTSYASVSESIHSHLESGYTAIRVQTSVPGIRRLYGVVSDDKGSGAHAGYEPADRGSRPMEEDWDSAAYIRYVPSVIERVRQEFGADLPLLHDAHHRLTPIEAAKLGQRLEPFDMFWLEDCTPAENQDGLRLVRRHTVTPLAIGEVFNSVWDFQQLISEQLIDYVRASATHFGGITPLRKVMDFAALYQIRSGFHGPTDISPVGLAAQLHVGMAINNFGIQEYMGHSAETRLVFHESMMFQEGLMHPGHTPGLGVELDEECAKEFPYHQAYLPVTRLRDGSIHDW